MSTQPLTPLPVDLVDLCIALENESAGFHWFFDLKTGETILLNHEYDSEDYGGVTPEEIEETPARFRRVPTATLTQALEDMKAFADSLADGQLKESLLLALAAPRPEKRFRAVLGWLPDELDQWHTFRHGLLNGRALQWLEKLGVKALPPEGAS